jgi:hypothetical protein
MTFWSAQLGPYYEGDPRSDETRRGHRCIGEVVCPDCRNVMGRLLEGPDGIELIAWVPARGQAPGDPGGRRVGWSLYAPITNKFPADEERAVLVCWRGHKGLWISGADCRAAIARYKVRGRKVRQPAKRLRPPSTQPDKL